MYLAQLFDHITNQPLGFVQMHAQDDRRIALDEGLSPLICTACEMFIRSLGINHFQAQIDNFELPAKNYISPTTLLFTPYLDAQVLFRLLDQTDPELVINVAIDKYQYALGMSNTDFQRIKGAFLNSHLGENAPVYDKQCCDAGHLSALCIYRRRAGLKNDRTWTSNALGNTTAPKPTNWDRLCPRHEAERIANEQAAIIDRNLHRARNRGHDNDDNSGNKSGSVDSGDYESGSGDEEEDEDEDEEFEEDDGDFYEDD
ncbi:hypothetical protein E2P81_ATG02753 [Venturia nashicola]|nr:hypothetical protein E2P81_ATG02753 [Venturia nashicola]